MESQAASAQQNDAAASSIDTAEADRGGDDDMTRSNIVIVADTLTMILMERSLFLLGDVVST